MTDCASPTDQLETCTTRRMRNPRYHQRYTRRSSTAYEEIKLCSFHPSTSHNLFLLPRHHAHHHPPSISRNTIPQELSPPPQPTYSTQKYKPQTLPHRAYVHPPRLTHRLATLALEAASPALTGENGLAPSVRL